MPNFAKSLLNANKKFCIFSRNVSCAGNFKPGLFVGTDIIVEILKFYDKGIKKSEFSAKTQFLKLVIFQLSGKN